MIKFDLVVSTIAIFAASTVVMYRSVLAVVVMAVDVAVGDARRGGNAICSFVGEGNNAGADWWRFRRVYNVRSLLW
jgi:hypothetical protein